MTQSHDHPPRTRRSPEIWESARHDYVAGSSSTVIAERYGLNARSVRRRAVLEGWRRRDEAGEVYGRLRDRLRHDSEETPELAAVERVNEDDMFDLLFLPDPMTLSGFAFRRAAASAATDGPAEAATWLRVAHLAAQFHARVDFAIQPFSRADYLRAGMMHTPAPPADGGEAVETESGMSAMTAEIRGAPDSAG
jgi:hypothetical protein